MFARYAGYQGATGGGYTDGVDQPKHRHRADVQGHGGEDVLPTHHTGLRDTGTVILAK